MSAGRCSMLAAPRVVTSVVALVIALAAAPLDAQTKVGLRVGFGAATLSGDDPGIRRTTAFDGTRYAIVPSIDAGIPLSGPLGVRLGLGLAQKGGAAEVPSSVTTGRALTEAKTELGYFQVSALLRAGTDAQQGDLNFGVLAGPYVGLNLSCNVALTGHETVTPPRPPVPPGEPNRVPALGMTAAGTAECCAGQGHSVRRGRDQRGQLNRLRTRLRRRVRGEAVGFHGPGVRTALRQGSVRDQR